MTTTTERYTPERILYLATSFHPKSEVARVYTQAATDATTLQSLRDENARLRKAMESIEGHMSNDPVIAFDIKACLRIARNALKENG